jgi:hypothetical protein
MLCSNCSKLALLNSNKTCVRCKGSVLNNIAVLCDGCSIKEKKCAVCVKTIISNSDRATKRGCNCGGK